LNLVHARRQGSTTWRRNSSTVQSIYLCSNNEALGMELSKINFHWRQDWNWSQLILSVATISPSQAQKPSLIRCRVCYKQQEVMKTDAQCEE
jgi:hypothetical protein